MVYMNRFSKLLNIQKPEDTQDESLAAFDKFSQANKQNIGLDTSLGVADTFKNAYQGTQDLRQKAIEKIAEQTDLGKDISGVGPNQDYRNVAKTGLDMIIPDVTDVLPAAKAGGAANALFPILGMAAKEGKLLNFAKKSEKTAEELMRDIRKADSSDLKLGSNLINTPVLKTAEEKAAQQLPGAFGKVSTPDMGKQISNTDLMKELEKSKIWNDHRANREMFKNDNAKYMNIKEQMIAAARKKLSGP